MLRLCEDLDRTSPHTAPGVRDRTDCWKRLQLEGASDSLVLSRYRAAVADYDAILNADSVRVANDTSATIIAPRLAAAQRAMQGRDLDSATRVLDAVLSAQPDNQRALAFRDRIDALRRADALKRTLFLIGAGVLAVSLLLAAAARLLAKRHGHAAAARRVAADQQKAMIEIVDGVGRGKMYTLDAPVFRIGSALSDKPEERNHLILSDAQAFISRYHCSIIRKHGQFYLIDSSLNGTYIEDQLLDRGEPRVLEDGEEFSLAGMARMKFLLM